MNKTTVAQQAETASFLPPAQAILQRKCTCGNHTVAGGECAECAKQKNTLQRKANPQDELGTNFSPPSMLVMQRKLMIGASHDPLEREADQVADQVVANRTASSSVSSLAFGRLQREDAPKEKTNEEKYKEGLEKLGEAFLKTPLGKELLEKIKQDTLVKGVTAFGQDFISTWRGKIVTGAAAAGAVAALAVTHKELPAQIPEIPLDILTPGLSVQLTYKGPVDKPTEAMITFKFTEQAPKGTADKKPMSETDKFRAETARLAAEDAKFRAGMTYKPGSPEDLQQKAEQAAIKSSIAKYAGGPDLNAMVKRYPWLAPQPPKTGMQLTPPKPSFGYKSPSLFGDEFKLKLPGEQKQKEDEPRLQRKLTIGASNDSLEQEADRVADQVSAAPAHSAVSGAPRIQRYARPATGEVDTAPTSVDRVLASSGRPLGPALQEDMEQCFGHDFSRVRVHSGGAAEQSARDVNAHAYTVGHDIVFGAGRFAPRTQKGRQLLAHELAHVVQQRTAGHTLPLRVQRKDDADALVTEVLSVAGAIAALAKAKALDVDAGDHKAALEIVIKVRKYLQDTITDAAVRETFKGVVTSLMAGGSMNIDIIIRMAVGSVKSLEGKLRSGQTGSSGTWNYHLTEVGAGQELMQQVERNPKARPQTKSDPNALIPVADFITYVEAVEKGYPNNKADEIVTRIRQLYYQGAAFDRLIPGARRKDGNVTRLPSEDRIGADAQRHLASRADENAIQDNPSPYIVLGDGTRIDVGHLLLGLDALIHTIPPEDPYKTYQVSAIDPASWVADLGIAAVWMEQHEQGTQPDSPRKLSSPDLDAYYKMSAPNEDLVGDIDSFALGKVFSLRSNWPLSKMMRAYYLGVGDKAAIDKRGRYQVFCLTNQLTYNQSGTSITWAFDRKAMIERIDRFNDLFGAGTFAAATATYITTPTHKQWKYTPAVLDRFLNWLKPRLQAELAANPPAAKP